MDSHKIENHESASGEPFPDFQKVLGEELGMLQARVYTLFCASYDIRLPQEMAKTHELVVSTFPQNAAEHGFSLIDCFQQFGIQPTERLYINWGKFDEIDAMLTSDLTRAFDSIWYPGVDDIELFDESLAWMMAIAHDGTVELRFGRAQEARSI